ncbi:MAG: beta-N-acetylhexosaminidase [Anaerolineae bacterium]|nr:beta-N-acetylhexosaminidase [Anaerolineae bacterium]
MMRLIRAAGVLLQPRYCSLTLILSLLFGSWSTHASDPWSDWPLERRIAQMFIINLDSSILTESGRDFLAAVQPGGIVLLPENIGDPAAITILTNSYQQTITTAGGVPLFVAVDQEGGVIAHLEQGFTTFPVLALMTAAADPALAYRVGQVMAQEMAAVGVNLNLAPVADLETNPANPIIRRRSFGSRPEQVSPILAAYIAGLQSADVMGTAKHFPGHGETATDSHIQLPTVDLSLDRLNAVELAPFRAAVEAGVGAIMVAHIWYPALDPVENRPASLSPTVITDLLREQMGYDGLIMTDALDMDAIDRAYSYPEAALLAVQAGADLILSAHVGLTSHQQAIALIAEAVRSGALPESRIDESLRRILDAKARFGILDWQPLDPAGASQRIDRNAHERLVTELFAAGTAVVFDRSDLLPLRASESVVLAYPATRPSIARQCQAVLPDAHLIGVSASPSDEEIAWVRSSASRADVIVYFTQNADQDTRQVALVRALPPEKTIVAALWSPYDVLQFPEIAAYLVTYSPLDPAIPAVCAILSGAAPPHGQMVIALPGLDG